MNSIGEMRVRTTFNPSDNDHVTKIKNKTAELINLVQATPVAEGTYPEAKVAEFGRLRSLAMTAYEEAAMWAVKAATL